MPLRLEPVSSTALPDFGYLTFPAVLKVAMEQSGTARAVVASTDDGPAGLAISLPGPSGQFEVMSLFVAPLFRLQGVGTALLDAVESDFSGLGYSLGVHFMTIGEDDQHHVKFCKARGWSAPSVTKLVCRSNMSLAFQTPWLVEAELPARYVIVDWSAVDAGQRAALKAAIGDWVSDDVSPFQHEQNCDAATSVALVEAATGDVLGWVITHRLDDQTLRWTCSYLMPRLQSSGLMRAIWLETARRQRRQTGLAEFCFTAAVTEPRMARFALRRMKPWLSGLAYSCTTTKRVA